ncbi:hypothetical protein G9A89_021772 [Geosiphon pyriformis]|nr:hypothetical protein G9A89_021772 [Geosiphon pyriformis]
MPVLEKTFTPKHKTKIGNGNFKPDISKCVLDEKFGSPNQENFLTYLPHSGFHNQRIELENAIFLAWYTNRTLVMPPIIFGKIVSWSAFPGRLEGILSFLKPDKRLSDCHSKNSKDTSRCVERFYSYTLMPWDQLFDFSKLRKHIRIMNRDDFSEKNLYEMLNVNETYHTRSSSRYDYQLFDELRKTDKQTPFLARMSLCKYQERKERLIFFSSLFSSTRILTHLPNNVESRDFIKRNLVFGHKTLLQVVDSIVTRLGGVGNFIGSHWRLGDHGYQTHLGEIVEHMMSAIKANGTLPALVQSYQTACPQRAIPSLNPEFDNQPIFMATDLVPEDPALAPIFSTFSCVFTLSNFTDQLLPLTMVRNQRDNAPLYQYFVPLVDLIVASRGGKFFGTMGSTFSSFAQRLHQLSVPDDEGELVSIGYTIYHPSEFHSKDSMDD